MHGFIKIDLRGGNSAVGTGTGSVDSLAASRACSGGENPPLSATRPRQVSPGMQGLCEHGSVQSCGTGSCQWETTGDNARGQGTGGLESALQSVAPQGGPGSCESILSGLRLCLSSGYDFDGSEEYQVYGNAGDDCPRRHGTSAGGLAFGSKYASC